MSHLWASPLFCYSCQKNHIHLRKIFIFLQRHLNAQDLPYVEGCRKNRQSMIWESHNILGISKIFLPSACQGPVSFSLKKNNFLKFILHPIPNLILPHSIAIYTNVCNNSIMYVPGPICLKKKKNSEYCFLHFSLLLSIP